MDVLTRYQISQNALCLHSQEHARQLLIHTWRISNADLHTFTASSQWRVWCSPAIDAAEARVTVSEKWIDIFSAGFC